MNHTSQCRLLFLPAFATAVFSAACLTGCRSDDALEQVEPQRTARVQSPDVIVDAADRILFGGVVWTVDEDNPRASAVAIKGEEIVGVGSDAEVQRLRGPGTVMTNLQGAFVVPGFNDTHIHFNSAAQFIEFNIMQASTQVDFVDAVEDAVTRIPEGQWILGGLWGAYDSWAVGSAGREARTEPFAPNMAAVANLTAKHPMYLRKFDNSEYAANATALRAIGLDPENPRAPDVVFVRDATGTPTGVFRGRGARNLFGAGSIPGFDDDRRRAQTRHALERIASFGVTSVSDMSDDQQVEIYKELIAAGQLTVRVDYRYMLDRWEYVAGQGFRAGPGQADKWLRFGGLKGHIDGIMGASSARFFEPYDSNPESRGRWRVLMTDDAGNFVEGKFLKYMLDADAAGLQMTVHAIGDEANNILLNYLEELAAENGERDRRFRLVHAQVIAPDDFLRVGELGVMAEVQPYHLSDDMRWMEERIGYERCKGAYAFKRIQDNGAVMCFGSDWPGTSAASYPINPMLGLFAAVTRQTVNQEPPEGWFPQERISIEDAIRAYTLNGAYSTFEEDRKGSITVGKLADIAVLNRNLLTCEPAEILTTEVLYTIVGGKVVYEK